MLAVKHLDVLQTEHLDWLKELQVYKQELNFMQKKIEEVAMKDSSHETLTRVEQFQNQFIRQREVIDELRHAIKAHENDLEKMFMLGTVSDRQVAIDHIEQRENFERFVQIFDELKESFDTFASRILL